MDGVGRYMKIEVNENGEETYVGCYY